MTAGHETEVGGVRMSTHTVAVRRGLTIEWISVGWMMLEAVVGLVTGVTAHSLALVAFGSDSIIELVAGGVLLWRLYVEARGATEDRVERAEQRAAWVVGTALLALAAYIVIMAGVDVWTRTAADASGWGLALAVAAGLIMPLLAQAKRRIGRDIGSAALVADGGCSLVCAYMAWTLLVGLVATDLFGWWWLNPLAGLALVYFIVSEGREALEEARGEHSAASCRLD